MSRRRGFTLVELLVVAVLGVILLLATYEVLVINQRTYTVQNQQVRVQRATSEAIAVLFGELREVSSRGGDILGFGDDRISVRVMRAYGAVCSASLGATPTFEVWVPLGGFAVGDSVFVYADNRESSSSDDTWIGARVTAVDTTVVCGPLRAERLTFEGQSEIFTADTVRAGAPVRAFERYVYGLFEVDGDTYLGRQDAAGQVTALIGPLEPSSSAAPGLEFRYLDREGAQAVTASGIREIEVTLRAASEATKRGGGAVRDSLTSRIYTRN